MILYRWSFSIPMRCLGLRLELCRATSSWCQPVAPTSNFWTWNHSFQKALAWFSMRVTWRSHKITISYHLLHWFVNGSCLLLAAWLKWADCVYITCSGIRYTAVFSKCNEVPLTFMKAPHATWWSCGLHERFLRQCLALSRGHFFPKWIWKKHFKHSTSLAPTSR